MATRGLRSGGSRVGEMLRRTLTIFYFRFEYVKTHSLELETLDFLQCRDLAVQLCISEGYRLVSISVAVQ